MSPNNYCLECGNEAPVKFCTKSCANAFNNRKRRRTTESKQAISDSLTGRSHDHGNGAKSCKVFIKECISCKKKFCTSAKLKRRRTCGNTVCLKQAKVENWTYRNKRKKVFKVENPTSKKVVSLDSSWELAMVEILNQNNIEWSRPRPLVWFDSTGKERHYFPDFYLPNQAVYLDPKNPACLAKDQEKLKALEPYFHILVGDVEHICTRLENTIKRPLAR